MIGTVEIYESFGEPEQQLVYSESNLVVNGAGETICDLFTTPSSLGVTEIGLLDSSNYTVQAISFGKSSQAYKNNGHFYPHRRFDQAPGQEFAQYTSMVKSDGRVRAASLSVENTPASSKSYDPKRDPGTPPNPNDKQLEPNTETSIDAVSGQFHFMGSEPMQGRAHAYGHNLNKIFCNTNPNLLSFTNGPTTDPDFVAGNNIYWSSSLGGILSSISYGDKSGPFYGTASFLVSSQSNKKLMSAPSGSLGHKLHRNVDHTFSMYAKHPTNVPTEESLSSLILEIRDTSGGVTAAVGFQYRNNLTTNGVLGSPSALVGFPSVALPGATTVNSSGATGRVTAASGADGSAGWYRFEIILPGLGNLKSEAKDGNAFDVRCRMFGASGNSFGMEMYGWQMEERYGASEYQSVVGVSPEFSERGIVGDTFLGCYPHASGTSWAILSSISHIPESAVNSAHSLVSGVYPKNVGEDDCPFFNSPKIRSMDENGFVRAYMPSATTGLSPAYPYNITSPLSGLIVSANSNFSSVGQVNYLCTIASGDLGLSNLFGGIYKIGLWSIDLKKTLSNIDPLGNPKMVPTFPLKFSSGYNRLVYKLFAEKNFTKNLGAIIDSGSGDGATNYRNLTIVWKLDFIGENQ